MESTNEKNKKPVIRVDRNFTKSPTVFTGFRRYGPLSSSVFIYGASLTPDIFGEVILDPEKFVHDMGYKSTAKLFEIVENPAQLQGLSKTERDKLQKSGEPLFRSRLDDCLYQMLKTNLTFASAPKTFSDGALIDIASYQVITHLTIYIDPKRKGKKTYGIKFNPVILNNIKHYYDHIVLDSFIKTREADLTPLYFMMVNLREYCLSTRVLAATPSFDSLCDVANVNDKETRQRKKKLTAKMVKLLKLAPELDFSYDYEKKTKESNFLYQPVITFNADPDERKQKAILINREKMSFVFEEIERGLENLFLDRYSDRFGKLDTMEGAGKFEAWKRDLNTDSADKTEIIYKAIQGNFPKNFNAWCKYPEEGHHKEKVYRNYFLTGTINAKGLF